MEVQNPIMFIFVSYYFHIFGARGPGLGAKAAGRARAGPLLQLWGRVPCPKMVKSYELNMKLIRCYCHIVFTFLDPGPGPGAPGARPQTM